MNNLIKNKLREKLNEGKHNHKYEYGCVMVYVNVNEDIWASYSDMIDKDDLYLGSDDDTGYAFETEPHITLLFGLHADVPLSDVESVISKIEEPSMVLQKISSFNNPQFGVLKFDVESDDLHKYNNMLTKLPHTTSYPDYHPHCTIAYIKPDKIQKYVDKFSNIEPLEFTVNKIVYSYPPDNKKEYPFGN